MRLEYTGKETVNLESFTLKPGMTFELDDDMGKQLLRERSDVRVAVTPKAKPKEKKTDKGE